MPADGADDLAKKGKHFATSTKLFRHLNETVSQPHGNCFSRCPGSCETSSLGGRSITHAPICCGASSPRHFVHARRRCRVGHLGMGCRTGPHPEARARVLQIGSPERGLPPLRGATIVGFDATGPASRKLTYEVAGRRGTVEYVVKDDGAATFTFTDPQGRSALAFPAVVTYTSCGGPTFR
jgi:hypothetical protein